MPKKVISIELCEWWTKVALTECYKKSPQIFELFYFRTPENAVEDGYIRDKDAFSEALREELARRQITEKDVIFTINSTKVITREITIPLVKDKQLPAIVQTQAKEHFPMDISGYTITYQKMVELVEDTGKNLKLLLIAVPDTLLSNIYSFAESAGLTVETFEYIGNSAVSFANAHFNEDGVVVQLQEQSTIISFIKNKKLVFQRVAPNGYGTTLATVLDHPVLGAQDEYEAFNFLTKYDVLYGKPMVEEFTGTGIEDLERRGEVLEDAYEDVRDALSYHIRVVYTALEYYRNQSKEDFSGKLHLIGDGARIAGLSQMFEEEIPLTFDKMDYASLLRFGRGGIGHDVAAVDFLTVIGATIAPLSIQPRELRDKETKKNTLKVAYGAFFASALISVALVGAGMLRLLLATTEQERLQRRIMELSYIQEIYDENEAARIEKEAFEWFDDQTKTDNERLPDLIAALEEQLPTSMTVQNFAITGSNITLNMTCTEKLTAAQLLLNLQEVPFLDNFSIPAMSENEDETGRIEWQFSVTATYVEPKPEPEAEGEE